MAGKRMLHSNICESEKLSTISYEAETLYYRLLTRVDDNGNFNADPRIVFGQCMTLREDMTPKKVADLLEELSTVSGKDKKPLIEFYEANGDQWIHFTKFEDFQYLRTDRQATVKFPPHPNEMGPVVPNSTKRFTIGKPEVNQEATSGIPSGVNGWPNISKEKLSKDNRREEGSPPSFGSGTWKTLAIKFRGTLGKFISSTKTNKQKYSEFCTQYGEDQVLKIFDEWVEQNKSWLSEKDDALFFFWRQLPELIEADASVRENQEPEIPEETVNEAIQESVSARQQEINKELQELSEAKKWEQEHRDEI